MNDAIAAAKYFRQPRPVENGSLGKHRSRFQITWRTNVEHHRGVTPVEQPGDEGQAEIPLSLLLAAPSSSFSARQYRGTQERSVCIEIGYPAPTS